LARREREHHTPVSSWSWRGEREEILRDKGLKH